MISIIVCTDNRAQTLRRMLEGFFSQQNLNRLEHELIVVDNNSNDDTPQVAREFSNKPFFLLRIMNFENHNQLSRGSLVS